MIDFNKYVGIPWRCGKSSIKGADCWGIVCIVYKDLFDIELDHFAVTSINSVDKTTMKIEKERRDNKKWDKVEHPIRGDVVMMFSRTSERPEHVGIYLSNGWVLHSLTRETGQSEIHKIKMLNKLFKKLEFYRYVTP